MINALEIEVVREILERLGDEYNDSCWISKIIHCIQPAFNRSQK